MVTITNSHERAEFSGRPSLPGKEIDLANRRADP